MENEAIHLLDLNELRLLAPALILGFTACLILLTDLFAPPSSLKFAIPVLAIAAPIASLFAHIYVTGGPAQLPTTILYGCLQFDRLVYVAHLIILGVALFFITISPSYLQGKLIARGEYYALMLFAAMAMLLLSASGELLTLFVNLEMLSFTLYILSGMEKENLRSTEAAFKYFLTGSYATAFMLFGMAMVYGALGTTSFGEIEAALVSGAPSGVLRDPLFLMGGFSLMMVGFGFKLTLAPFHMYAPDVYAGAPTTVAGMIGAGSKVASIVVFFEVFRLFALWNDAPAGFYYGFYGITVLSILVGNVGAVLQPNIKRLLAYSGVAHAGYAMIPLVAVISRPSLVQAAEDAITYYLLAYALMTSLAFGVAATLGPQGESQVDRYGGLARRSPFLAALLALALISLTGIPLTTGFVGKFYLFSVAIDAELYALAIFGVLASVASAYYYLRVIVKMYMEEGPAPAPEPVLLESTNTVALIAAGAGIVVFAIFPTLVFLR